MVPLIPKEGNRLYCAFLVDRIELARLKKGEVLDFLADLGAQEIFRRLVADHCTFEELKGPRRIRVGIHAVVMNDQEYEEALQHAYAEGRRHAGLRESELQQQLEDAYRELRNIGAPSTIFDRRVWERAGVYDAAAPENE